MIPILVKLSSSFQCRFFLTSLVSTQVCATLAIMGFLTYCLINELAISLQVFALTIDTVIAMAIPVVGLTFTLSITGFFEVPVATILLLYLHPTVKFF